MPIFQVSFICKLLLKRRLSLNCAVDHAAGEVFLNKEAEDHHGQHDDGSGCAHGAPLGALEGHEGRDGHGQSLAVAAGHDQGDQELIPGEHQAHDGGGGDGSLDQRQHDPGEGLPLVAAVNDGGFPQGHGHVPEVNGHQTLTLKLRTYAYMDNGDFDIAEISIDFTIVSFVVHSVSVNSSIKNISTKEIYGYFDKGIDLNFYFDKTDISYYNMEALNDPFWDTVYRWERGINLEAITNEDLKQIYTILQELNSYDNSKYIDDGSGELVANPNYGVNDYLILNDNKKDGDYYTYNGIPNNIELANNRLMVKYNSTDKVKYSPDHLAVAFKLYLNNSTNKWEIGNYASIYDEENYIVDTNYYLNFKKATAWFEPTVVT